MAEKQTLALPHHEAAAARPAGRSNRRSANEADARRAASGKLGWDSAAIKAHLTIMDQTDEFQPRRGMFDLAPGEGPTDALIWVERELTLIDALISQALRKGLKPK